jgi:hypothetical protein
MGVEEVRRAKDGTEPAQDCNILFEMITRIIRKWQVLKYVRE